MGRGCGKFGKSIMVKFSITSSCVKCIMVIIHSRNNLTSNHIDSRKIHALLSPVIMTGSISQPGMCSVIFNGMTQIPHMVSSAPVSKNLGKILIVKSCDSIHILVTNIFFQTLCICPEKRQIFFFKTKFFFQSIPPWKYHVSSHTAFCSLDISKTWLIREKALNGFSKFFFIMCIMRLIYFPDQHFCRLTHQRVQVILRCLLPAFFCKVYNKNTPRTFRHIQSQKTALPIHLFCNVTYAFCNHRISFFCSLADALRKQNLQDFLLRVRLIPWSSFQK